MRWANAYVFPDLTTQIPALPTMRLGELLLRSVRDAGAREIFGIPGDFVLPFFKVIEETGILPLHTMSPSVGFAADGAARWCRRPSVAAVTYGAGALNLVNPIAAAYAEKIPVVVISGGPGVNQDHTGLLLHHQAKRLDSQSEVFREVTCAQTRLKDRHTAGSEIGRVLTECLHQSRPVYIEIPRDCVELSCPGSAEISEGSAADSDAVDACTTEILATLARAKSPVLMVGVEARRFGLEDRVAHLARKLRIPVTTSFMGRGLLADSSSLIGTYMGVAGNAQITKAVENSDELFLLGVILSDTNLGISKRRINLSKCILAVDGRVSLGYHTYPDIPLKVLVDRMTTRLPEAIESSRAVDPEISEFEMLVGEQLVTPDDVAHGINLIVQRVGPMPIVSDVGDCLFVAMGIVRTGLAAPGYYASMGFSVPAGLGIQAASGERPLILLGDGAFQMTGWELGNCGRNGWDPIVVVLNNASWEMLRVFQPESKFNELAELDFRRLAEALGGNGFRVRTRGQLFDALESATKQRGRFQLIEVMLERGAVSGRMSRYVHGIREFQGSSKQTAGGIHSSRTDE